MPDGKDLVLAVILVFLVLGLFMVGYAVLSGENPLDWLNPNLRLTTITVFLTSNLIGCSGLAEMSMQQEVIEATIPSDEYGNDLFGTMKRTYRYIIRIEGISNEGIPVHVTKSGQFTFGCATPGARLHQTLDLRLPPGSYDATLVADDKPFSWGAPTPLRTSIKVNV